MTRNWGISRETSGATSGDQPQLRSLHGPYTTRADNIIPFSRSPRPSEDTPAWPNSRSQEVEFFIQPFEFGSYCLLVGFCLAPALIVGALVLGYALFIAEPI